MERLYDNILCDYFAVFAHNIAIVCVEFNIDNSAHVVIPKPKLY